MFPILRHLAAFFSVVWPRLRLGSHGIPQYFPRSKIVEDFKNDPLVFHGRFPLRTGTEILRAAGQVQQRLEEINLPLLVMHGTGDIVADPEGSRLIYTRASSADKTLRLYNGMYHEIFSELQREQVVNDLLAWLNARAP